MTAPRVIGIDPSLTGLGVAGPGWADTIRTKARRKATPVVDHAHQRMAYLQRELGEYLTSGADLAVVEGLALQPGFDMDRQLSWLNWTVRNMLWRRGIPYAVVSPTGLKRFVLGKGKRTVAQVAADDEAGRTAKDPVLEQVRQWLPGFDGDDNAADAAALRLMGLDWLGCPQVAVTAHQRGALAAVQWPEAAPLGVAA